MNYFSSLPLSLPFPLLMYRTWTKKKKAAGFTNKKDLDAY